MSYSDAALSAAVTAQRTSVAARCMADQTRDALAAAHDPALGLDRSVCLRDIYLALLEESDRIRCTCGQDRFPDPVHADDCPASADSGYDAMGLATAANFLLGRFGINREDLL